MNVRLATENDRQAIDGVEAAAFASHADVVVPLIHELRRTKAVALELVAAVDDAIVGHVMVSHGWLDTPHRLIHVHVLSPIGVAPGCQRQGIGRSLIDRVAELSSEQVPAIFLEGDPAYYSRMGFVQGTSKGFLRPSLRIPEPAFQVRLLAGFESWMTGTLVYPDAFWSLDAVGLR